MTGQKTLTTLGTEKTGKPLMQYAILAIIATTVFSLCNMVDGIFIGYGVGAMAISGLVLTFPLMNLAAAFGSLVGIGVTTLIPVRLGQKDYDTVQRVLGNVFVLNFIIDTFFTVVVLPFLDPILYFFGGSDRTVKYACKFAQVILLGNAVTRLYLGLNAVLRASGRPQKAMMATIMTVIINVLFIPLFVFVFDWGIRGAATAMVCVQLIALAWWLRLFCRKDEPIWLKKGTFRLKRKTVSDPLAIGMSPFPMNMASCFIVIPINQGLKEHRGGLAIGAFDIVNRIVFVFIMIVLGLNQGMQPIAGYNFGAKLYPRMTEVLKVATCRATVVTMIGFLTGMFTPEIVSSISTPDKELTSIASKGFRTVVFFYPIVGFQMVASNFFQSIGMANKVTFLLLTRRMLLLIPCLSILPHYYGQMGVWAGTSVADLVASLISGEMLWWQFRQLKKVTV